MRCEEIKEMLPSYVRGEDALTIRRHLARCPDCRVELERYEALAGSLASLRHVHAEPPRDLLPALISIPDASRLEAVRGHVVRNRKAYAGGLAVAFVGAAGAAVWRTRARRVATA